MTTHYGPIGLRHIILAALMLVTLGVVSLPTGSAAGTLGILQPTVGDIMVDTYNCETGELAFHVPVADLFAIDPNVTVFSDYPLVYAWAANYGAEDDLQQVFSGVLVWTPNPEQSPYTGVVNLEGVVPPADNGEAIAYIAFQVQVGPSDTLENPSDFSYKEYFTDCDTSGDDLVSQLIAKLKQILQDVLNA